MLWINVKDRGIALRHLLNLENAEPHVTDSPIVSGIPSALSAVNVQIHRPTAHQVSVSQPPNPVPTARAWWNPTFCKYIDLQIHCKQTHFLMFNTRFEFRAHFQGNTRRKSYHPREEMGKFSIGKTREGSKKWGNVFLPMKDIYNTLYGCWVRGSVGLEWDKEIYVISWPQPLNTTNKEVGTCSIWRK